MGKDINIISLILQYAPHLLRIKYIPQPTPRYPHPTTSRQIEAREAGANSEECIYFSLKTLVGSFHYPMGVKIMSGLLILYFQCLAHAYQWHFSNQ